MMILSVLLAVFLASIATMVVASNQERWGLVIVASAMMSWSMFGLMWLIASHVSELFLNYVR